MELRLTLHNNYQERNEEVSRKNSLHLPQVFQTSIHVCPLLLPRQKEALVDAIESRLFPKLSFLTEMSLKFSPSPPSLSSSRSTLINRPLNIPLTSLFTPFSGRGVPFGTLALLNPSHSNPSNYSRKPSSILSDTLRVLEWDKVCDSVASFASTSLGQEATKVQLWSMDQSYEDSKNLLTETKAAVEMIKYSAGILDFGSVDVSRVKSAIDQASVGLSVNGLGAMAISLLLQLADELQTNLKMAFREDPDWYSRFVPLAELIMEFVINRPLVKAVQQVIDEDGAINDSASVDLRRHRDQVRILENELHQLLNSLIRTQNNETSNLKMINIDGRWCIRSESDEPTTVMSCFLLSSGLDGNIVEPTTAIPLNDKLQQARRLVAKSEDEVLSRLTNKMREHLHDIKNLLNAITHLDVVTARAKYSLAFGGTCPDFTATKDKEAATDTFSSERLVSDEVSPACPSPRTWVMYMRKAYHPLLLQQHRETLQNARRGVSNRPVEVRRECGGENVKAEDNPDDLKSSETQITQLEESPPVPVDFVIPTKTRVLIVTGPNTGGKTISLKTVGLAALMAKSGLYVLASESVKIPWFDNIYADIGDEQSLEQSLSTFSGHLRQISAIRAQSTNKSLVLLDEVGAGTNPLEGAAIGMSILEAFAENGALLTMATTHHGELKTLKYSNSSFENACVEFDEVNLKPTYKILWGLPGRSNAIRIAERLGLPEIVSETAQRLYGSANAELNEVIVDMEKYKQEFRQHMHEAQNYLKLSRELLKKLLVVKQCITEHAITTRYKKLQEVSQIAANARSMLHRRAQQLRASATQFSSNIAADKKAENVLSSAEGKANDVSYPAEGKTNSVPFSTEVLQQTASEKQTKIPEVGDVVHIPSLCKKATVLKVQPSKGEIIVQARNMKLRLKLSDIESG